MPRERSCLPGESGESSCPPPPPPMVSLPAQPSPPSVSELRRASDHSATRYADRQARTRRPPGAASCCHCPPSPCGAQAGRGTACTQGKAAVGYAYGLPKSRLGTHPSKPGLLPAGQLGCSVLALGALCLAGERARRTCDLGGPTRAWDPHLARGTYCLALAHRARGVVSRHP